MNFDPKNMMSYIQEDIDRYKGVQIPIKAGFLERHLVKKAAPSKLHPNPDDEFSMPEIGPSMRIIAEYERKMRDGLFWKDNPWDEPVTVEKVYPDGYLILNGHHRWIAAMKAGFKRIPVKIVNLTSDEDIRQSLRQSRNDKRVAIDLDEIVFCTGENEKTEKAPVFPLNRFYTERVRLGMPAVIHSLVKHGYDIWVYTHDYRSVDHLRHLFEIYHMKADGIVTGTSRKSWKRDPKWKKLESDIMKKYAMTLNITVDDLVLIKSGIGEFDHYEFEESSQLWSEKVIAAIEKLESGNG